MLCRLALALVCGLALAAPSLADDNLPPTGITVIARPLPQADWKQLGGYPTREPIEQNRIFYARVPAQTQSWKPHLQKTEATLKALHQNFSRYGLLAIYIPSWQRGYSIDGVYLAGDDSVGVLRVQIRSLCPLSEPLLPRCLTSGPGPTDATYDLIAIRKDSLPARVKRLYITEVQ